MNKGKTKHLVSLYNELVTRPKPLTDAEIRVKYASLFRNLRG